MNERIRKLLNEATSGLEPDLSPQRTVTLNEMEKFAELIVRECVEQVWYTREDGINGNVSEVIKDRIKQHFGVEEPKGWVCPKCNADRTKIACPLGFGATVDGRCPMTVEAQ